MTVLPKTTSMKLHRPSMLAAQSGPTLCNPWTVGCQAPLSIEFSRQEYWRGLPFPPPGDLPDPGIEHGSPPLEADSLLSEPPGTPIGQSYQKFASEKVITVVLSVGVQFYKLSQC